MTKRYIQLLVLLFLLFGVAPVMAQADDQLAGVELQAMADTFQDALENNPSSQASDWVNPDSNRSGAVVPIRTFQNAQGQPCREFTTRIVIGDQEEQGYGTACRQPDGSWQLVGDERQKASPAPLKTTVVNPTPPPVYYAYPPGFYGTNSIYLSFGTVYRSGKRHRGYHYMDGPTFRQRHPIKVRNQVYLGPGLFFRYRVHDELRYRDWERHNSIHEDRGRRSSGDWYEKKGDRRSRSRGDDDHGKRRGGHN